RPSRMRRRYSERMGVVWCRALGCANLAPVGAWRQVTPTRRSPLVAASPDGFMPYTSPEVVRPSGPSRPHRRPRSAGIAATIAFVCAACNPPLTADEARRLDAGLSDADTSVDLGEVE